MIDYTVSFTSVDPTTKRVSTTEVRLSDKPSVAVTPTGVNASLDMGEAQALLDAMWKAGMRPTASSWPD